MSVTPSATTGLEILRTTGVKRPSPRLEAVTEDLVRRAHATGNRGRLHRYWRRDPALVSAFMLAHPLQLAGAAGLGRFKDVKRLLEAGHPVDAVDAEGWTPLMRAARAGHTGIVGLLLAAGADVKRATPKGRTALMCAQERRRADVIVQLAMAGAFELGAADTKLDTITALKGGSVDAAWFQHTFGFLPSSGGESPRYPFVTNCMYGGFRLSDDAETQLTRMRQDAGLEPAKLNWRDERHRWDPMLAQVVREMGPGASAEWFSSLQIRDTISQDQIDANAWELSDNDGMEELVINYSKLALYMARQAKARVMESGGKSDFEKLRGLEFILEWAFENVL